MPTIAMPVFHSWRDFKPDRRKHQPQMALKMKANGGTPKAAAQLDAFAQRQRHLADQLRAHGLDGMLDVPKIVIVGSQSAGKSSVLEALSQIAFPRAAGTCTRCPTDVMLSHDDAPWQCEVFTRLLKDSAGNDLSEVKEVQFGETIYDPDLVGDRIARAQRYVLDPERGHDFFLDAKPKAMAQNKGVTFTENLVALRVRGPACPNLTLVDLPGIIANVAEGEPPENIELIKRLARQHIKSDNTIILLAITMGDDFQNQSGVTLAREADKNGLRTLGVLTKPDLIQEGEFGNWLPVLTGKVNNLRLGYHVVKNPTTVQLQQGISFDAARASEETFLQAADWRNVPADVKTRLGTRKLSARLSTLLGELIKQKLPGIIRQLREQQGAVTAELQQLPREIKPAESVTFLIGLIQDFVAGMASRIDSDSPKPEFRTKLKNICVELQRKLYRLHPIIAPLMREEVKTAEQTDLFRKGVTLSDDALPKPNVEPSFERKHMSLTDILQHREKFTSDMLPCNCPWSVKKELIQQCVEPWQALAEDAFAEARILLDDECAKLVATHFKRWNVGGLDTAVAASIAEIIKEAQQSAWSFIENVYALEHWPHTLNEAGFQTKRKQYLEAFYKARREVMPEQNSRQLMTTGERNVLTATLSRVLPADSPLRDVDMLFRDTKHDYELTIAAEVCSSWHIAFYRFIDVFQGALTVHFVQPVSRNACARIFRDLSLTGEDGETRALNYLCEDYEIAATRETLRNKKERLDRGLKGVSEFTRGDSS